jgi:hypothetical protein
MFLLKYLAELSEKNTKTKVEVNDISDSNSQNRCPVQADQKRSDARHPTIFIRLRRADE